MFNMVIITIGLIEFILGIIVAVFAKSTKINRYISFLYEEIAEVTPGMLKKINRWIGQNYSLSGSLYVFFGSLSKSFDLGTIMLLLCIGCIEVFSYKRINKGIVKILGDSQ